MTTRKPKLRFLSALLAVAMLLTLLPTAAFAAAAGDTLTVTNDKTKASETVYLTANRIPDATKGTSGNGWSWNQQDNQLTINAGFTVAGDESVLVGCSKVINNGTIQSGKYMTVDNNGTIIHCVATVLLNNYGTVQNATANGLYNYSGTICDGEYNNIWNKGGTIKDGKSGGLNNNNTAGTRIEGGTYWGGSLGSNYAAGTIVGGVYSDTFAADLKKKGALPEDITYTLTAYNSKINDQFEDSANVVVGDAVQYPQKITLKASSSKFTKWEGIDEAWLASGYTLKSNPVVFNMPAENLNVIAVETKTDLVESVKDGIPTYSGSRYNGWEYNSTKNTLTIYNGYDFDLTGVTLSCIVVNSGNLTGGVYKEKVTNTGTGTISSATFQAEAATENRGKIAKSAFYSSVLNGSSKVAYDCSVEDSTFHNGLSNYAKVKNCGIDTKGVTNYDTGTFINVTSAVGCQVTNYGVIKSGTYSGRVTNGGTTLGTIEDGLFEDVTTNQKSGKICGGTFIKTVVRKDNSQILGGIFKLDPQVENQHQITAKDCNFNDNENLKSAVFVVGNSQKITVKTNGRKFKQWSANGIDISSCPKKDAGDYKVIELDFSTLTFDTDDIEIFAEKYPTDVIIGTNGTPVYEDGVDCVGGEYDGWTYDIQHNRLNISDKYTLDIGESTKENPVDWRVENNGMIRSGSFAGTVSNYATIENGTYLNAVTNYGTVKNGTYAGRFVNSTRTTTDADGNTIYADGIVENGVFSRYADFGNQAEVMPINGEDGFNVLWIKLGDATVNDCITEQAGIVGAENIVVTANNEKSFDHWSVSGDADLTEIQKQLVGHEKDTALHLTLSGTEGGMILLTAETNALPGVLTAKNFDFKAPADLTADGTAKNATVTTEKTGVGEIALHYYDAEGNLLAKAPTKAGTYTVTIDVAGTDKYEATTLSDPDWSFTVAEKTYNVTVVNGVSAMTTAAAGAKVTVKANAAPAGQKFSKWVSDSENVLFVEKTDAETSFIMPEGDVTITAAYEKLPEEPEPEVKSYMLHVFDGETEVEGVLVSEAKAGETVTVRLLRNAIPGGQTFDHWEALPETLELKDASAAETTFVMPEEAVTLRAVYRDIVVAPAKPSTASVVAATAVIGTGVVLAGWTAYNMGTELYAKWVLPAGAEMPATRGELAALLWQEAGSPEPADAVETMTDAEKAAQWAVESGLMTESKDAGFAPEKKVGKLEVFMTLKKAETLKK